MFFYSLLLLGSFDLQRGRLYHVLFGEYIITDDLRDKGFDLLGESLLAVRKDDHGLDPARNVNTSLLVDKANVSRMEPAVLVDGFFVIIVSEQLLYNSNSIKFN